MATSNPVQQWVLPDADGLHSLKLEKPASLGLLADDEVEVEIHAASLNYRDLMIAKVRQAM